jgi:hypothetical protein
LDVLLVAAALAVVLDGAVDWATAVDVTWAPA